MEDKDEKGKIRTLASDIQRSVKKSGVKSASKALRDFQQSEEEKQGIEKPKKTGLLFIGLATILLILGFLVLFLAFFDDQDDQNETQTGLYADQQSTLDLSDLDRDNAREIFSELSNQPTAGPLTTFLPIRKTADQVIPMTAEEFFTALEVRAPENLFTRLQDQFLLGLWQDQELFLLLNFDSFAHGYQAVLNWENNLFEDISIFLHPQETMTSFENVFTFEFEEKMVNNRQIRVLEDENGQSVLVSGFANENTLIITSSQQALLDIISRLKTIEGVIQ